MADHGKRMMRTSAVRLRREDPTDPPSATIYRSSLATRFSSISRGIIQDAQRDREISTLSQLIHEPTEANLMSSRRKG